MIEHADQLVLEYVSRAADAAHGVLRPEQRIDFVHRLRARIDAERRGSESAAVAEKVLAIFGDPAVLVEREVRRLAGETPGRTAGPAPRPVPADPPTLVASVEPVTQELPAVEARPPGTAPAARAPLPAGAPPGGGLRAVPPGMARSMEEARRMLAGERSGTRFARRRRRSGRDGGDGEEPGGPEGAGRARGRRPRGGRARAGRARGGWRTGRDRRAGDGWDASGAVAVLAGHPREVAGLVVLALAALLVPLPLAPIAVFPVPAVVWAVGAVIVLSCAGWEVGDKVLGAAVPVFAYSVGGVVAAFVRTGGRFDLMVADFFEVSGVMFVIGTALGVLWLVHRLVSPPAPLTGRTR
ncbi:hypothetical protein [Planomonospora venezuelensis]|uniref:Uncharacterized protein n=1 Tax=Planomonospora venezuelensis TaxID=1999 RepID=A0A841D9H3_PLAVE|nr:hypothetical protein [Planomonospora venezuelensis]MBB5965267.1 hypothetical protein [Planomonospora venezuelensis]GIN00499.1 hypothetical protein Pve01_21570 [Planomonospora venezuelensis]